MFIKILKINIILLFLCTFGFAESIVNIEVDGNKRISKESIIVFGKITTKTKYSDADLNQVLKNLYETDFFKAVNLSIDKNTLKITVIENPIIEELEINGIKSKKLTEMLLDQIELKSRKSYIETTFIKDLNLIKNIIKASGYYFATIKTSSVTNEVQNSIKLIYDIELGKKAKIDKIVFLGDKKIKDRKLKNIITSEESKFWKFISNRSFLDKERINLDKRLLTSYYKDHGYYNATINDSFVEFKDDGSFKLIFDINAGNKFTFNNLNLVIPTDFDEKYFAGIIEILSDFKGKKYSLNKVEKILQSIDKVALSKQYEFIDATISEKIIDDNKLDITINLIETEKFYVEKINILGNQYTLEEVIRNSFIVDEGDPYNEILFNKSINNIKSKNIFKTINSSIKEGSNENLKIVDVVVEEKPTGEISLGAGVGTSGGTIGGGIKENNFLGKGIQLNTDLTISENSVKGKFVYVKPNFNNSENTLFTSIRSTSTDNLSDFGYKTNETGFSLGTNFEQYENLYFKPEISTIFETLETTTAASTNLKKQEGDYFDLYFNYALNYDLRNRSYRPTDGQKTIFYQELPLVSDNSEIINSFEFTKFKSLPSEMVGRLSFYARAVNTLTNNDVRISKRLYMPQHRLRGFEMGKIGPIENNDFVGGNYASSLNVSTTLPQLLPSFQNTDVSLFIDAANVWGVDYSSSIDESNKIRSSAGVALDLLTPIGPLNFSLTQPITKASTDKTESFRFNLGTTF